jgi:hypothetical protein
MDALRNINHLLHAQPARFFDGHADKVLRGQMNVSMGLEQVNGFTAFKFCPIDALLVSRGAG